MSNNKSSILIGSLGKKGKNKLMVVRKEGSGRKMLLGLDAHSKPNFLLLFWKLTHEASNPTLLIWYNIIFSPKLLFLKSHLSYHHNHHHNLRWMMLNAWKWYQRCLAVHPVKTQIISSGFLWGLGDVAAQTITHSTLHKQHLHNPVSIIGVLLRFFLLGCVWMCLKLQLVWTF